MKIQETCQQLGIGRLRQIKLTQQTFVVLSFYNKTFNKKSFLV